MRPGSQHVLLAGWAATSIQVPPGSSPKFHSGFRKGKANMRSTDIGQTRHGSNLKVVNARAAGRDYLSALVALVRPGMAKPSPLD